MTWKDWIGGQFTVSSEGDRNVFIRNSPTSVQKASCSVLWKPDQQERCSDKQGNNIKCNDPLFRTTSVTTRFIYPLLPYLLQGSMYRVVYPPSIESNRVEVSTLIKWRFGDLLYSSKAFVLLILNGIYCEWYFI